MKWAIARGILFGTGIGLGAGGVVGAVGVVRASMFLSQAAADTPVDRARILANAIAESLYNATLTGALAPLITIPLAVAWCVRRERQRGGRG